MSMKKKKAIEALDAAIEQAESLAKVFCPTGQGGGRDPTCSPGGGRGDSGGSGGDGGNGDDPDDYEDDSDDSEDDGQDEEPGTLADAQEGYNEEVVSKTRDVLTEITYEVQEGKISKANRAAAVGTLQSYQQDSQNDPESFLAGLPGDQLGDDPELIVDNLFESVIETVARGKGLSSLEREIMTQAVGHMNRTIDAVEDDTDALEDLMAQHEDVFRHPDEFEE